MVLPMKNYDVITFLKDGDNRSTIYAHVDRVSAFSIIEKLLKFVENVELDSPKATVIKLDGELLERNG